MVRPARVEVNLTALQHNFNKVLKCFAHNSTKPVGIFVAAKDDAYGHGLITVAKALRAVSSQVGFALCSLDEALQLIEADIKQPILLLAGFFSTEELEIISRHQIECVIHSDWQVKAIEKARLAHPIKVWLKINTGMNRLGFALDAVDKAYNRLKQYTQVADIVFMMHFACADEPEHPLNKQQIDNFVRVIQAYPAHEISVFNSAGIMNFCRKVPVFHRSEFAVDSIVNSQIDSSAREQWHRKQFFRKQWLRPGLMIYGASPLVGLEPDDLGLKQSMTLKSNIISLYEVKAGEFVGYSATYKADKLMKLAVVALGYGDGYPFVPAGTQVLVHGHLAGVVGRVSMDLMTIDVSAVPQANVGSEVIFWNQSLPLNRIAESMKVAPHMLMTSLNSRVKREYVWD